MNEEQFIIMPFSLGPKNFLYSLSVHESDALRLFTRKYLGGSSQKFPDWPPGTRTGNDKALCH
jgi:hypothetical protein